mmetsp:Transcript_36695/g.117733  ORF Transcript_36695/g.117733 Transcript_36695/m.117733 type:complete len:114 (-) Transcript_36695:1363-1704(-)
MDEDEDEERTDENEFVSDEALMHNRSAIDSYRSYMTIIAGIGTGILGATGLRGLGLFLLSYLVISLALVLKMRLDTEAYTNTKLLSFLFANLGRYGLSFVLFWTLAYALVFIY